MTGASPDTTKSEAIHFSVPDSTHPAIVSVFPNPSENSFTISITNLSDIRPSLSSNSQFELQITDIEGRPVYKTSQIFSGNYQVIWNAESVSNGIYFYRIKLNGKTFAGKMGKI